MPNPSGANQFAKQPAYGDVKKLMNLEKAAPLAGANTTSIGAPKRAQRRATGAHGARQSAAAPVAMAPVPAPMPDYNAQIREVWAQLAAMAPNDPNIQYYAQKSQES